MVYIPQPNLNEKSSFYDSGFDNHLIRTGDGFAPIEDKPPVSIMAYNTPRKWGESRAGEMYPQIEGPGNPSWEARNPDKNPNYIPPITPGDSLTPLPILNEKEEEFRIERPVVDIPITERLESLPIATLPVEDIVLEKTPIDIPMATDFLMVLLK